MKWPAFASVLAAGILVSGCVFHKHQTPAPAPAPAAPSVIVTPDTSLAASVVRCNSAGRFVVLNFPVGRMPAVGQTLFLYRAGLKQGEVKISGPQRESYIVADIVTGDARVGDEVRDR
jgi:hypothetical protein